jgi:hypothetical protein
MMFKMETHLSSDFILAQFLAHWYRHVTVPLSHSSFEIQALVAQDHFKTAELTAAEKVIGVQQAPHGYECDTA